MCKTVRDDHLDVVRFTKKKQQITSHQKLHTDENTIRCQGRQRNMTLDAANQNEVASSVKDQMSRVLLIFFSFSSSTFQKVKIT